MGKQIDENFVKTYSDKQYQHTAMVNHRGTVVSFAMDDQRRIYYAVLNISQEDKKKGPLDVKYWVDNPQLLSFPAEIEQVGFAVLNPVQMPTVKKDTRLEASATTTVSPSEADAFLSTTARLTADAPFQVFSDNQHIYLFRQSLAGNHADMVHKLKSGGSSGTETDLTKFVTDSANNKVPLVTKTLLVDRFILAGTELKLPREVRFRRSENRTSPASAKDSLGAKDMEGNAFSETTKELDFIKNLDKGCFSVILLPTQVADIERWQLFAYNNTTKLIDSFNIERNEDGFFNLQGTQLYTSPDERYKTSVLERKPGKCPFTALPLVPTVSKSGYAEMALQFDSSDAHVNLRNPAALKITGDQTIEMWIKPTVLGKRQNPFNKAFGGEGTITLEPNGGLSYYYGTAGNDSPTYQEFTTIAAIAVNTWVHIAIVRDLTNMTLHWYINGEPSGSAAAEHAAATAGNQPVLIGKGYAGNFTGLIDEVRVWNRARSGSEIKNALNHRLIGDEFGLAGYWRFDEAAGTEVKDLTSNGNHGTLSSNAVKWVASDAPIGEHPGMQRTSFAFSNREVDTGLAARLYYQQEKLASAAGGKAVKQNARVLLTAVTSGLDPIVPIRKGLALYLTGESYLGGNQWDDLSGQGRHAFTTYGSPMPSLHQVTNYNGKNFPVMRFVNGPGMKMSNNQMDAPFTAIIVDRYIDLASDASTLASAAYKEGESHWHLGKRYGKNLFYTQKGGTGEDQRVYVAQAEDAINDVFSINTGTIEGTNANWYLDGVNKGSTTIGSVSGTLFLGQRGLDADIACVLIWDRVLTNNERQTVEKWLGTKYGINVNHPINFSATDKKYVAAVDFNVSRAGKLAQAPDIVPLPTLLSADSGGVASVGILGEISSLETEIATLETEIATLETELAILKTQPYRQSLGDINQKRRQLWSKNPELTTKRARLTQLRQEKFGVPPSQPMHRFHTDPQGLTVSSGLLGFAYTDSQPYLFESALGRMAMYFKGLNKQFFSAYYDVNTARARWSLAAGSGSLTLVSHTSDSEANNTAIVVANGGDADHCNVTLENTRAGLTETWNDVPREVAAFAQVLNGEAGEKVFVGKLKTTLSGTATTTIDLKDSLPREAPAGSTLLVEDSSSGSKQTSRLIVGATAASGAKQITVISATPTLNADAKVYLLLYDYTSKASSNRSGYTLDNGNLQVNVVVGSATGNVGNATASRTTEAQSPQWTADAPGSALYFDGTDDYLDGQPHNSFQHQGDITMEAWARPLGFTGDSRLMHCKSGASHYSLGLRQTSLNSALSFDGSVDDYIDFGNSATLQITGDQTIEMWINPTELNKRQNPFDKAYGGEGAITLEADGQLTYYYGTHGGRGEPHQGFGSDAIISSGSWVHIAIVRDLTNMTLHWYINGEPSGSAAAEHAAATAGNQPVLIGKGYTGKFTGSIDEVRIWNIARDATDIKANMSRRLGGQESGLTAYYHFELGSADDRSGNGHHGSLHGNLTSRAPVASPLKAYTCFASVGSDAIATIEPIVSHSWHHYAAVYNQSYALQFDGEDFGDAGNESMLNISEDLTIEAFVKLDSLGRKHGIVSKGIMDNGGGSSMPYAFYIDESGKLVLAFEDEDGQNYSYSSSSRVTAGAFKRVAVVRKIGREKIEKTGTTPVRYTDSQGAEQTRDLTTIESIDFGCGSFKTTPDG